MKSPQSLLPESVPENAFDPFERAGFEGCPKVRAAYRTRALETDFQGPLSSEEQDRLARLQAPGRRAELESSLRVRRGLVAELTHALPGHVRISRLPDGAPRLDQPEGWAMSLSHKGPWTVVALALSPAEIGVDVERVREIDWRPMLKMICSDDERAAVETSGFDEHAALIHFFRMWTIKEAVLKSTTQGFRAGPKGVLTPTEILTGPGAGQLNAFGATYDFWTTDFGDAIFSLVCKRP